MRETVSFRKAETVEDKQIIELFWSRDEQAISALDEKYGEFCRHIAFNILKSAEDCEECVNDTYLKVWNSIPPQMPEFLRAFLSRITRNLAFDRYKTKMREKRGGGESVIAINELENCISSSTDIQDEYLTKELGEAIGRFLRTLTERDRDIFVARYYFVSSVDEIAEKLGLSSKYVWNILSRTRRKLKIFLEKEGYSI